MFNKFVLTKFYLTNLILKLPSLEYSLHQECSENLLLANFISRKINCWKDAYKRKDFCKNNYGNFRCKEFCFTSSFYQAYTRNLNDYFNNKGQI